jgi:hypothetical protein
VGIDSAGPDSVADTSSRIGTLTFDVASEFGSPELLLPSPTCIDVRVVERFREDSAEPDGVGCEETASSRRVCTRLTSLTQPPDSGNEAFPEFRRLDPRPELDGLRAVAVVPVVLFLFCNLRGGFAGVDAFFVISGYLVTAILIHELSVGRFSYRHFLLRRARRLFPAIAALLAVLLAVSWHRILADTYSKLLSQAWAVIIFGANIHFYTRADDYFRASSKEPLLHCWSLAVEEQFISPCHFFFGRVGG